MARSPISGRALTREQALENRAFLKALARTGNVRLAAREVGVRYGTIQHRRKHHPAFAQRWEAALATAQARLNRRLDPAAPAAARVPVGKCDVHRTQGGEPVIVRTPDGRVQVRRSQPGKLTRACEQAFLSALSATANIALSAAAAGGAEAAFHRRRRNNPAFAREMRMALAMGYERVDMALVAGFRIGSHEDDAWRHNEPPTMPAMTPAQALQLLYLHQKEARFFDQRPDRRRRRNEREATHAARIRARYIADLAREAEDQMLATVLRNLKRGAVRHEQPPLLPALDQVTGWSKADPAKVPTREGLALFGGWRLEDWEAREGKD
ncbi:hypothetical protein Q5H91_01435 [Sphingomonas sp. KR1UV-12]|uniref:Uncharacterized protein n=1 Tax=Sphingomonas aurea TaxID=3063994 RepID=A0ABT9EFX1_9SPHN|nr:hypothetical protein [Sphingomonas sp. KR1UV-12]MDP1025866.1 hypothetical protein [Sphingomonas sp. KR1UV-12]